MRKSRFNKQQIIAILKEFEAGMKSAEVCRRQPPMRHRRSTAALGPGDRAVSAAVLNALGLVGETLVDRLGRARRRLARVAGSGAAGCVVAVRTTVGAASRD